MQKIKLSLKNPKIVAGIFSAITIFVMTLLRLLGVPTILSDTVALLFGLIGSILYILGYSEIIHHDHLKSDRT